MILRDYDVCDMKRLTTGRVTISRSVYLTPEHDEAASALAERLGTDVNKALRVLIQKGLDAPDLPEFVLAKLKTLAATRKQSVSDFVSEQLIRIALDAPESRK